MILKHVFFEAVLVIISQLFFIAGKFEDSVPFGIDTGDLIGMDFRIDNKNYNKLKKDCNKAQKKLVISFLVNLDFF